MNELKKIADDGFHGARRARSLSAAVGITGLLLGAASSFAQPTTNAYDVVANYTGFSNGLNKGIGFGPWQLSTTGGGALLANSGLDIWNNTANAATTALRPFNSPLAVGGVITLGLRFGVLDTAQISEGIQFQDASGNALFTYSHHGAAVNFGEGDYTDANGSGTAVGFAYNNGNYSTYTFTLNSATSYTFTDTNTSASFSGTLSGAPIAQVLFFRTNQNYKPSSGQDFAFNKLMVTTATNTMMVLQPISTVGILGRSVTLKSQAVSPLSMSYQWYLGNVALAGATNSNLVLTNAEMTQTGNYQVVVSTSSDSATSAVAAVTLYAPMDLFSYEGFNYAPATSISTLNGGFGWGGAWGIRSGGPILTTAASLSGGANTPPGYDALSVGEAMSVANNSRATRVLDNSITGIFATNGYLNAAGNIGVNGTTLYISFLAKADGTGNYCEFELHRKDLSDAGRIGGIGCFGGGTVSLRTGGTTTPIGTANTLQNFYVMRIDFHGGSDDVRVYRNPISTSEPGIPTLTMLGAADMSFDSFAIGAYGTPISIDEVRLGETWQTVVPVQSVPPVFNVQPLYNAGSVGSNLTLSASALSLDAVSYQWYKGATQIAGATSANLVLTNLGLASAGSYYVIATTVVGSVTSAVSMVTVYVANNRLMAYEGFGYDSNSSIASLNGGSGWATPWSMVVGDTNAIKTTEVSLVGTTNVPPGFDGRSVGVALGTTPTSRTGRFLDCSTNGLFALRGYVDANGNIGADGKTLYVSFLQLPGQTASYYEFELHHGSFADADRIAGIGNDLSGTNVNLRTAGMQTAIGLGDNTAPNFYVVRIDFKTGNDDVRVYRNPNSLTEPGTADLVLLGVSDLSFNAIAIGSWANSVTVDEIRVGSTWEDSLGLPVSKLLPLTQTAQGWNVNFIGTPGFTYRIQSATDIAGPWGDLGTLATPESEMGTYLDATPSTGKMFYRTVTP